jgi:integrase
MGRKFKVCATQTAKAIRKNQTEAIAYKRSLIALSIKESTRQQYQSQINWLKEILAALGTTELTETIFFTALRVIEHDFEGHKAEQLRDAILFHIRTTGEWSNQLGWAEHKDTITACRGFRYQGGNRGSCNRGASTEAGVDRFIEKLRKHHLEEFIPLVQVKFGAALRRSELINLQVGDYDEKRRVLRLRANKRRTATKNVRQDLQHKHIVDEVAHTALSMLQKQYRNEWGKLMFPKERTPITRFAEYYKKWYPRDHKQLKFTPHSLRHGGVGKIVQQVPEVPSHQAASTLQSKTMRRWYARSNKQRVQDL